MFSRSEAVSAPADQDASWRSYSFRTVTVRGGGGRRGGGVGCGKSTGVGGVVGCSI